MVHLIWVAWVTKTIFYKIIKGSKRSLLPFILDISEKVYICVKQTKNIMKNLFLALGLMIGLSVYSQNVSDTIYKKNKEVVLGKVTEVGLDEVKYKPLVNPNDIVLVLEKTEILKIVFASGLVQTFANPMTDKSVYADNHNFNIKFNFLSPMGDRIHLNMEKSIRPGLSYEVGLNAIGVGKRYGIYTPVGAVLNAGIRMYRLPDMKSRSDRYAHVMNGSYFQPTLSGGFTQHSYDDFFFDPMTYNYQFLGIKKANTSFFMFTLNFGRQYVFANRISFDVSAGVGYGTYTRQKNYDNYFLFGNYFYDGNVSENAFKYYDKTRYGFDIGQKNSPLTGNIQFKVGYLLH